jgi:hypothetical protein
MFNLPIYQKPSSEIFYTMITTMEKTMQASLDLASTVCKAYWNTCSSCCKFSEETAEQAGKTISGVTKS